MTTHHSVANVAALVGEPTRAAILLALLDGSTRPASELARVAGLSAAATSLHLAKLVQGGLIIVRREGRHRYHQLASADVAHALEALGVIATAPPPTRSLSPEREALRAARACYDHLAGTLAVAFVELLERKHVLQGRDQRNYAVTKGGVRWFADVFAIDVATLAHGRRALARRCLDWTERRPHLAGALGHALFERCIERRWLARTFGGRTVRVTTRGEKEFAALGLLPRETRRLP
jgi:DNA-binding transcriptional ArsR family regulator